MTPAAPSPGPLGTPDGASPEDDHVAHLPLVEDAQDVGPEPKPTWRGWLHAGMTPVALVLGIVLIAVADGTAARIACAVFVASSLLLFGVSAVYHLLDGVPLDPWMSVGVGYRQTKLELADSTSFTYQGFEALRLALGFDNYLSPAFGLGPSVELMLGRYGSRSPGEMGSSGTHASLMFGLRAVFSPF